MTTLTLTKRDTAANLDMLRKSGVVPGVCYGSNTESTPVSFSDSDFRKVYRHAGSSSVIDLAGDFAGKQCFIQDMQVHVVSGEILHVDFKIVDQSQETEVSVPVEITGEATAVAKKLGLLNVAQHELMIAAVPSKIPHQISIDVTSLMEVGDSIKVSDLNLGKDVRILEDADEVVVTISALHEESETNGPSMADVLAEPKK